MTEAEWLTSTDVRKITKVLAQPLPKRKCILAYCAHGRRIESFSAFREVVDYLKEAEEAADGRGLLESSFDHFQAVFGTIEGRLTHNTPQYAICYTLLWGLHIAASDKPYFGTALSHSLRAGVTQLIHPDPGRYSLDLRDHTEDWVKVFNAESTVQTDILRDIFGNPFRPVTFELEWRTTTAVAVAAQIYESRDFGAMPILADALQDAGCESAEILDHCRGSGPHVRACWVVDCVLGKA